MIFARFALLMEGIESFDVGQRIQLLIKNMLQDRENNWSNAKKSVNQVIMTPKQIADAEMRKTQQAHQQSNQGGNYNNN